MRCGFERGRKQPEYLRICLRGEVIGQAAAEFGLNFQRCLAHRTSEKPLQHLVRRDRIAVARQRLRMRAARNDFAVDQHAVAVEDDEIETHGQDFTKTYVLSSSSGTQYNSSR